jgi:hypothetical protein
MRKSAKYIIACLALGVGLPSSLCAQESMRSAYFMDGFTYRHELNPAFMGEHNYISIPILANMNIGINSNVGVNTFLYKMPNGQLTTFMNSSVDATSFLNKLSTTNKVTSDINITLLSAGFKAFKGYNTITIGARTFVGASLPKDLFTFAKLGMTSDETYYNFKNVTVKANAVAEIALGHSHDINSKITVGGKLNILLGVGNVNTKIANMDVRLSDQQWSVQADAQMDIAAGSGLYVPTKQEAGKEYDKAEMADLVDWEDIDYDKFGLSGAGASVDLGVVYKIIPDLTLSASILDFGFMNWSHNIKAKTANTAWTFNGFHEVTFNKNQPNYDDNKLDEQFDQLTDDLEDLVSFHRTEADGSRSQMLAPTISLAAEYTMPFYRKLTGGFLFTQKINGVFSWTEGRLSANVKPVKWFDASINYGVSTYGSSFGWIVNFHPKGFNFFIGSDHQFFKITPQVIPVGNASASISFGMNVTFGS